MGLLVIALGLFLWYSAHFFKRRYPARRAAMGERGKGAVAAILVIATVLMVIGYIYAPFRPVYLPIENIGYLNNILMIVALILFGGGSKGSYIASKMRHPMLIGFIIWAVAHLLVNGDFASVLLFGGLLLWAIGEIFIINRSEDWTPTAATFGRRDMILIGVWLVMYVIITAIHIWLGHNPFLGTYS